MMERFHQVAHKYIDVPFKHQGRTDMGLDCVGLAVRCAIDCGYMGIEEAPYAKEPAHHFLQHMVEKHMQGPMDRELKINDLAIMCLRKGGPPVHAGIITYHPDGLGIIHTFGAIGKVVYHRVPEELMDRLIAIYQWPENS